MMRRYLLALAAFFVKPDPPSVAVLKIIFNAHRDHGPDPRKCEIHASNQSSITNAANAVIGNAVEQLIRLVYGYGRRFYGSSATIQAREKVQ
jgi:hypothetical protein